MLIALIWYTLFWATLASWSRQFGHPPLGVIAVHAAGAPVAFANDLALWSGVRRTEYGVRE